MPKARNLVTLVLIAGLLPILAVTGAWLLLGRAGLDARSALIGILAGLAVHLAIVLGALFADRALSRGEAPARGDDRAAAATAPVERLARAFALERRDLRGPSIRRFLLYAMPRAARPVPVEINEAIGVCIEAIRAESTRRRGPTLIFDPAPDAGRCAIDPDLLHQVILNLILNARDAAGPSGFVSVRTQRLDDEILVAVRDSGPGVPPSEIGGLFHRPFVTAKPRALGIGLATCRRIVADHGGTISAINVLPHGLEVGVKFRPPANASRAGAERPESGRAA